MITEEQIARFFKKECTAEEAEQVAAWLNSHLELADKYLDNEEYNALKQTEHLSEETKVKVWHYLHQNIRKQKTIWLKRSAVAAFVAGCIMVSLLLFTKNKTTSPSIASYKNETKTNVSLTDTEYNYTRTTRRIALKDGSVVSLSPQSFIWFHTPFSGTQRDVYLSGEARFEVAKNKQKPFIVYSGSFTTTALGTEFIVKQKNGNMNVRLLHGKVVIKNIDNSIRNWKNIYLLPGQQMMYEATNELATVSDIKDKKAVSVNEAITKNNTQSETIDSIMFTATAMEDVLQKLRGYYAVNIQFNPSDMKHISFTGVIAKKDGVENILKVITQMNGLSVEKKDSGFIISKYKNEQ